MLAPALIALTALAATGSAEACRVHLMPAQKLKIGYETGTIQGAAIVAIEEAEPLEANPLQSQGALEPWQGTARIVYDIEGDELPERVTFALGYGSSMCETGYFPFPQEGDLFAVYFWYSESEGRLLPWKVYSLEEARRADPRVFALTTALRVRP